MCVCAYTVNIILNYKEKGSEKIWAIFFAQLSTYLQRFLLPGINRYIIPSFLTPNVCLRERVVRG